MRNARSQHEVVKPLIQNKSEHDEVGFNVFQKLHEYKNYYYV